LPRVPWRRRKPSILGASPPRSGRAPGSGGRRIRSGPCHTGALRSQAAARVSLAIACLVGVQSGQSTASATAQGRNGLIAYASGREIVVIRPDGTHRRAITSDPGDDILPVWSPTGRRIAWAHQSWRGGPYDLWVAWADGSHRRNLTSRSRSGSRYASWSPTGRSIVFMSSRSGGIEIWKMRVDGSRVRRLTFNSGIEDCCPDWRPTGRRIVFESDRFGRFELLSMRTDGSGLRRLTRNNIYDGTPAYSPDGRWIAYNSASDIWVMRADGTRRRRLTTAPGIDRTPSWSPNGKLIVFVSGRTGTNQVWLMRRDGSHERRLTNEPAGAYDPDWRPLPSS
jgi:TolB protein